MVAEANSILIGSRRNQSSMKGTEIIRHVCDGLTSKQIGERIFLSVRTVEGIRMKILEKMEVKNTAGIIITLSRTISTHRKRSEATTLQ